MPINVLELAFSESCGLNTSIHIVKDQLFEAEYVSRTYLFELVAYCAHSSENFPLLRSL